MAGRTADVMMARGRAKLVKAIRELSADGMSERKIAALVGRSQPEVHRLVHFHGSTPNGRALRKARSEVLRILKREGLARPRVFGSTVRGEDSGESDIDLLVSLPQSLGYMAQARLNRDLTMAVGVPADFVFDNAIKPEFEQRIRAEAVPL